MRRVNTGCVDLIYLDPPFNSNKQYKGGANTKMAEAKFEDIWHMEDLDEDYIWSLDYEHDVNHRGLADIINASEHSYGDNMKAYLLFMAPRLVEMRRILKPTGSIYYHCDPTASHYIKAIMDCIFGAKNYRNEIIWKRTRRGFKGSKAKAKRLNSNTDTILFYAKSDAAFFDQTRIAEPYEPGYVEKAFKFEDENGRYYLDTAHNRPSAKASPTLCYEYKGFFPPFESGWKTGRARMEELDEAGEIVESKGFLYRKIRPRAGRIRNTLWDDIVETLGYEDTGYPTQKPLKLLERIIKASSDIDYVIFDPFAGSATTLVQAEILNRNWFGCDISNVSELITDRLKNTNPIFFGDNPVKSIRTNTITRTDGAETKAEKAPAIREHVRDIYKEQDQMCANCSMEIRLASHTNADVERLLKHFKPSFKRPLSQGGTLDVSNRKLICIGCYYES